MYRKLLPEERARLEVALATHKQECLEISASLNAGLLSVEFPEELLVEIFKCCIARWNLDQSDDPAPHDLLAMQEADSRPLGWIRITHICRRWRDVALRTPALWTTLQVRVSNSLCVAEFISRSCGLPLSVEGILHAHSIFSPPNTVELWSSILAQSHRIWCLKIRYGQIPGVPEGLESDLSFGEPEFPILRELSIHGSTDRAHPTTSLPPMLKNLEQRCGLKRLSTQLLSQRLSSSLISDTITSLVLDATMFTQSEEGWTDLVTTLRRLPGLELLQLSGAFPPTLPNTNIPSALELPLLSTEPIPLPNLKTCIIGSLAIASPLPLLLRNLALPPGCKLRLTVGAGLLEEVSAEDIKHIGHLLNNKVDVHLKSEVSRPHLSMLVEAHDDFESTICDTVITCWATAYPIPLKSWLKVVPRSRFLSHSLMYKLHMHDQIPEDVLHDLVGPATLKSLSALMLDTLPRAVDTDLSLPEAEYLQRVFVEAKNVQALYVRGRLAEQVPALLHPSTAGKAPLFANLKALSLSEVDFLERDVQGNLQRGAWWNALIDTLREREKHSPSLRLDTITLEDEESITIQEVNDLKEFADEVIWDEKEATK